MGEEDAQKASPAALDRWSAAGATEFPPRTTVFVGASVINCCPNLVSLKLRDGESCYSSIVEPTTRLAAFAKRVLVDHDDVVETFSSDGSDQAFYMGDCQGHRGAVRNLSG
jgi:hypothetical protein